MKDKKSSLMESYYKLKRESVTDDEWESKYKEAAQNNKNEYYESFLKEKRKHNS